jgi:periplasmic protein TonB
MKRSEPRRDIVKQTSRPVLLASTTLSVFVVMGVFYANPHLEHTREYAAKNPETADIVNIPPTTQQKREIAPARPQVPVIADEDVDIDAVTIARTDLVYEEALPVPDRFAEDQVLVEDVGVLEYWMVEEQPKLVKEAMPVYPEIARQAGMDGDVWLEMVVGKTGRVAEVRVLKGPPVFQAAAMETAMKWVFTPAKQNDIPVRVKVTRKVSFRLN